MTRLPLWALAIALVVGCGGAENHAQQPTPPEQAKRAVPAVSGIATITTAELRHHVETLASDDYLGRGTNEAGARKAAVYLAREFRKYGLSPLPAHHLAVAYQLEAGGFDPAHTALAVKSGSFASELKAGVDFAPFAFSGTGRAEAPMVFAGYGITAPELKYDDYKGLDVKGKIVLVLRHYPNEQNKSSAFRRSRHSYFANKAMNAAKHGAVGMLLVTDPRNHKGADDLRMGGHLRLPIKRRVRRGPRRARRRRGLPRIPAIHLSQSAAEKLIAARGKRLLDLQRSVDEGKPASGLGLGAIDVVVSVGARKKPKLVSADNIVGVVEGSDPTLKHEYVVVGGHYDHLGAFKGPGDTIYNGADDNASGTSGVLALGRAFASLPRAQRPKRSVVFMLFSGEEHGLLGSRALVRQDLIPRDKIVFMLNLDMIGRNPKKPIEVVGDGYASGLRKIVETANKTDKLRLAFGGTSYAANSDHDSFFQKTIPVMFFFTGLHKDYHQLTDHADKLAYPRMTRIVRVAYNVVDDIANAAVPPQFIHHIPWLGVAMRAKQMAGKRHIVITHVDPDSRAAKAGLKVNDRVQTIAGIRVDSSASVSQAFRMVRPGVKTSIVVQRNGNTVTANVERARRGYLGVMLGRVRAERRKKLGLPSTEGVLIRGLAGNGPAGKAGIKAGDILLRIAGRPVNTRSLGRVLARIGAGEPVEIVVLRNDKRLKRKLVLGQRPQRRRRP